MAHTQSELQVITFAKDLCSYVMTITQKSPKVIDEAEMGTHTEYMDFYMDALRDIDRRLTQK